MRTLLKGARANGYGVIDLLNLIPMLLRGLHKITGSLANKSEDNPKKSAGIGGLAGILALFGVAPESITGIGSILVKVGTWLTKL